MDEKTRRKIEKAIRNRSSYYVFKRMLEAIKTKTPYEALVAFYEILDARHAFGSMTNSNYAKESLELLKRDEGL